MIGNKIQRTGKYLYFPEKINNFSDFYFTYGTLARGFSLLKTKEKSDLSGFTPCGCIQLRLIFSINGTSSRG